MPYFDLDLSNYKNRFGDYVEPGRYHVVVEDAEMAESKAGNPMVNLWYRVVSDNEETNGKTLTDRLTLTEAALFRAVGFLGALGIPTPKKRLRIDFQKILNRHLQVDVSDREYQGRISTNVDGYLKWSGGGAGATGADLEDLPVSDDKAEDLPDETPAPAAETPATDDAPATASPEVAGEPETWNLDEIEI